MKALSQQGLHPKISKQVEKLTISQYQRHLTSVKLITSFHSCVTTLHITTSFIEKKNNSRCTDEKSAETGKTAKPIE